ncbi:Swi3-domain-containing protein [Heliocybe sulcata]|uniref:Chromosome segregation in meiosis protein n=1 Tax=Heliocybe sulcata TaxID=5364 RepID=A0A5C3NAQ6_9AGAM|nr:Swi3-domain-containing protein [Heliocybe sulcata]
MSAVALEDIWDTPVEPTTPVRASRRSSGGDDGDPPRPSRRPLFLDSDSEGDEPKISKGTAQARPSVRPDIDAMFDNLDDDADAFQGLAPSLDMDALQREAEQRHAGSSQSNLHAILPSSSPSRDQDNVTNTAGQGNNKSSKDGPKERKVLPKLDEARLLGPDGFPALIAEAKKFKPRGKGQETADLNRVIQLYQFWTHKLYPKMQFRDTVNRVEKLCHTKRMHVALSVWRDEAKDLINGMKPDDPIDLASDSEDDDADDGEQTRGQTRAASIDDVRGDVAASHPPPTKASRPPSSPSVGPATDVDDFDIDAMIREQEEMEADQVSASRETLARAANGKEAPRPVSKDKDAMDLDEEAMWDQMMMDDFTSANPDLPGPPLSQPGELQVEKSNSMEGSNAVNDEDMWDIVREMEMESRGPASPPQVAVSVPEPSVGPVNGRPEEFSAMASPQKKRRISNADDWDDMYI